MIHLFGVAELAAVVVLSGPVAQTPPQADQPFEQKFDVKKSDLVSMGKNPYFILEPGYALVLAGSEGGRKCTLVITVLDETKVVDGVETRVVEERESVGDTLVEVSRNYFAISKRTHDVYYFGEDVDIYQDGKIASHSGSWLAGEGENRFGLAMPGAPQVGQRYFQEFAPGVALDRAKVVSLTDSLTTPAGQFTDVLKVEETSQTEPGSREYKFYARGIGLLKDQELTLVRTSRKKPD